MTNEEKVKKMNEHFAKHDGFLKDFQKAQVPLARHHNDMGQLLKKELIDDGVKIQNDSKGKFTILENQNE